MNSIILMKPQITKFMDKTIEKQKLLAEDLTNEKKLLVHVGTKFIQVTHPSTNQTQCCLTLKWETSAFLRSCMGSPIV